MKTGDDWRWLRQVIIVAAALSVMSKSANSDPQTNLVNKGCSQHNAPHVEDFYANLDATFSKLRKELSGGDGRWFATQQSWSADPVYAMVQCRKYMTAADCLACYDVAAVQIKNECYPVNGARIIYDGCTLRYESYKFYKKPVLQGIGQSCSIGTAPDLQSAFKSEAQALLLDLKQATPRIEGFYAANMRKVVNDGNLTIYGLAQCAETISSKLCRSCLNEAYDNIEGCLPYSDGRAFDAACFLRYSIVPFFADNQTVDIQPYLGNSSKRNKIIGGVAAALVLILIAFLFWRKWQKSGRDIKLGETELLQGPNIYSFKELKKATNNFSEENKLGKGASGDVYKATLENGKVVAVKKLTKSLSAKADFETEVRLISNVHHCNLIRLLGFCSNTSKPLLVYEYMANGSLDRFLYGEKRGVLSWKQRLNIILGTARGLAYLHEQNNLHIIHRDIKPGNILLDNNFQAKIADFGLARLSPEDESHVSTTFAGTLGYIAPEYVTLGHLSEKVDTYYSFGVVILEIISGRKSSYFNPESDSQYLLAKARKLYESDMHQQLADTALDQNDYKPEDVKKMVEIALICMQSPPSSRPTMSEIFHMLVSNLEIEPMTPRTPTFNSGIRSLSESSSPFTGSSDSNATVYVTQITDVKCVSLADEMSV